MKNLFLIVLLSFGLNQVFSQNDTIYYDADWEEVDWREEATFYRLWEIDDKSENYIFEDFYLSGKIQAKGTFKTEKTKIKIGLATWYAENGNKTQEGKYEKGSKVGLWKKWYKDGKNKDVINYVNNNTEVLDKWNKDGTAQVKNGNGTYTNYWENGNIKITGEISDKFKNGTWKNYTKESELENEAIYSDGKLVKGVSYKDGKKYKYTVYESMPYFKSCKNKDADTEYNCTMKTIQGYTAKVDYPQDAIDADKQGKVYISLNIGKNGKVRDVKILRTSGHKSLDISAKKHIEKLPRMIPGEQRGQKVKVRFNIPIHFKLG